MRAYRKPQQAVSRDRFHFVPFHTGVDFNLGRERQLRNDGMAALKAGDYRAARYAFKAALQLNPRVRTYLRLLRTYLPGSRRPAPDPSAEV